MEESGLYYVPTLPDMLVDESRPHASDGGRRGKKEDAGGYVIGDVAAGSGRTPAPGFHNEHPSRAVPDAAERLLEDSRERNVLVMDSDQVQNLQLEREMCLATNRRAAETNLSLKPRLEGGKGQLLARYQKLKEIHERVTGKRAALEMCLANADPEKLISVLEGDVAKVEEESEELTEAFLSGQTVLDMFLGRFAELRRCAHTRRIALEKLRAIAHSPRPLRPPPPPSLPPGPRAPSSLPPQGCSLLSGISHLPLRRAPGHRPLHNVPWGSSLFPRGIPASELAPIFPAPSFPAPRSLEASSSQREAPSYLAGAPPTPWELPPTPWELLRFPDFRQPPTLPMGITSPAPSPLWPPMVRVPPPLPPNPSAGHVPHTPSSPPSPEFYPTAPLSARPSTVYARPLTHCAPQCPTIHHVCPTSDPPCLTVYAQPDSLCPSAQLFTLSARPLSHHASQLPIVHRVHLTSVSPRPVSHTYLVLRIKGNIQD
ncbi:vacuolar protein sorting-associated protein 37B-like [Narcine bancroftii]|uniref:vacuolar protein sorting-associated protein 37B-like n=1 Tax=Narcine bancroftii TaxID=1343680 RepID=UPI003831739C